MEGHERSEKCREIFGLLSEYLNLELPQGACEEMEAHIAGCAPCIEFAESLRKTVDVCREYRPAVVPEPLRSEARQLLLEAYSGMLAARRKSSQ